MATETGAVEMICPNCGGEMKPMSTAKRTPWVCRKCSSQSKPLLRTLLAQEKADGIVRRI